MTNKQVKLTIAIPTFKRNEKLRNCLASLKNQRNQNFKVLVFDNDFANTMDFEEIGSAFREFKYFKHRKNVGPIANLRLLVDSADTEFVMFLSDDDDLYCPNCVDKILQKIEQFAKANVLSFGYNWTDGGSSKIRMGSEQVYHNPLDYRALRGLLESFSFSSTIFRTQQLRMHNIFCFDCPSVDILALICLSNVGSVVRVNDTIVNYLHHDGGAIATLDVERWFENLKVTAELKNNKSSVYRTNVIAYFIIDSFVRLYSSKLPFRQKLRLLLIFRSAGLAALLKTCYIYLVWKIGTKNAP